MINKKQIKKLIKNPIETIKNYIKNNTIYLDELKNIDIENSNVKIYLNIAPWKRKIIQEYYPEEHPVFLPLKSDLKKYHKIFKKIKMLEFIIWGYSESKTQENYIKEQGFKLKRMEDGFIRSMGLGAAHTRPLSLVRDSKELYFSKKDNDLKDILNSYDFKKNPDLIERSKKCIEKIQEYSLTKYNFVEDEINIENIYGAKTRKRILVIGQVESDASIIHGMEKKMTNNELVIAAKYNNPEAEIIYRPHPDVLLGFRDKESDPKEVENIAKILIEPIPFTKSLETIDEVYTMTSLTGFEALLRGIKVTTYGKPFYAGWGLTNDKFEMPERTKKLSLEELFAGAYILYPDYFDYFTKEKVQIEEVIDYFIKWKKIIKTEKKHLKIRNINNERELKNI